MNIIRIIKFKHLNGEFDSPEDIDIKKFISMFDGLIVCNQFYNIRVEDDTNHIRLKDKHNYYYFDFDLKRKNLWCDPGVIRKVMRNSDGNIKHIVKFFLEEHLGLINSQIKSNKIYKYLTEVNKNKFSKKRPN